MATCTDLISKLKKYLGRLRGRLPEMSPIGRTAFDIFAGGVLDTYGLPNTPGYRQAIATMILQTPRLYITRYSVANQIKKAQVNETAYAIMKEVQEDKKRALADAEKVPVSGAV